MKNEKTITEKYYSCWVGTDIARVKSNISSVYSEERNKIIAGYDRCFDLYFFARNNQLIISYGEKARRGIDDLQYNLSEDWSILFQKKSITLSS